MESACGLAGLVAFLLALGAVWSAKPACPGKDLVTCDAGTFYNAAKCACEDCPEGTFSSHTGVRRPSCTLCRSCLGVFQDKISCSRTRDAQCECHTGLRCIDKDCLACQWNCQGGEEPADKGCRKCPHETFNNDTNGFCKPWTKCDSKGLRVLAMGNNMTDSVCTSLAVAGVTGSNSITYPLIIAVSVFLFVCVVCPAMIMVAWVKKKVKDEFKQVPAQIVKAAESEDACSYHFPEEEQGDSATHMLPEA